MIFLPLPKRSCCSVLLLPVVMRDGTQWKRFQVLLWHRQPASITTVVLWGSLFRYPNRGPDNQEGYLVTNRPAACTAWILLNKGLLHIPSKTE